MSEREREKQLWFIHFSLYWNDNDHESVQMSKHCTRMENFCDYEYDSPV